MKKILSILLNTLFYFTCISQNISSGVYLSGNDAAENTVSFPDPGNLKYRMHISDRSPSAFIKISVGDCVYTFQKDSVFGYRDKQNKMYRFFENDIYQMLNSDEMIVIYSRKGMGGFENSQTIVSYYFSHGINAPLLPLTKWNPKNSFPDNPVFHELLNMSFNRDEELTRYDSFYKIYKVNRLLFKSTNNK